VSVCEEIAKSIMDLATKLTEAQLARGVHPSEIKRQLEVLMELARLTLEKSGCPVQLDGLKQLIDEADEDSRELEEAARAVKG